MDSQGLLQKMLEIMAQKKASDLHLKVGLKPVIRKNKQLYLLDDQFPALTNTDIHNMIDPLITAQLKEHYKQNKNIDFGRNFKNIGRLRFCVFSQRGTLRVTARLIPENVPSMDQLNLPPSLSRLVDCRNGLILITGSTGSGKSSTAAALIDYLNQKYSYHIITIENPIEYVINDRRSCITQRELFLDYNNPSEAFRSALRQDPDVIFLGEMRDAENISIALQAAESGHLVISTLHTSSAIDSLNRCISYFQGDRQESIRTQLIHCLQAIISQRLIPSTKKGLVPLVEILINNTRMQQALLERKNIQQITEIIESSIENTGMQSFDQHIIQMIQKGLIHEEEGLRYASQPHNVRMMCKGIVSSDKTSLVNLMKKNAS